MDPEEKSTIESGKLDATKIQFQEFFNHTPDIITIISFENQQLGNFIEINKSGLEKLGYSHDKFLKLSLEDIIVPDISSDIQEEISRIKSGKSYFETEFITKNGERIPVEMNNSLFQIDGRNVILSISRDITERELAEEALNENLNKYRLISENTSDVIWIYNIPSKSINFISPSIFRLIGYKAEELLNQPLKTIIGSETFQYLAKSTLERISALESGDESAKVRTDLIDLRKKDGSTVPTEVVTTLLTDNGKVSQIMGVSRDISKRKKVEDALRESEEYNRSIMATSPDCIKVLDLDGNILMMSESGQKLMEVDDVSCILNTNLIDFYSDKFKPDARKAITRARKGKTGRFTAYCPTLKGTPKWWDVIITPILNAQGKPEKLSAVSRDITALKLADEKLRWSEERLKMGLDMAKMVYWEYNTEKHLFTFDDQFYALYGTTAEEEGGNMISGQEYMERFVDPDAYELIEKEFAKAFEVDDPNFISTPKHWIIRADGERRFIQVRFKIMYDENGKKIGTRGVNQDITELKIAEDKLKLNQDLLLMSMDMANLVKWEYDIKTDLFTFDDHFYALYGTNAQEQGGYQMSPAEYVNRFVPPEEREHVRKEAARVMKIEDPDIISTIQHGIVRSDGERRVISLRLKSIFDENNQKIGTRGVTQDITEIKKVEEDLQKTKAELERIIESSPAAIIVLDFDGRVRRWSPAAERIFGWTEKEVIGKISPTIPSDFIETLHIELDRLKNGKETIFNPLLKPFEVEVVKKDGSKIPISLSVAPIQGVSGKPEAVINVMTDLSERKEFEEKLKKSIEEKEMLLKEIHHRVKNNLMIISSLLNLQTNYLKDPESIDIFKESQHRAESMALIHQRLYQSTDLKSIDFQEYITTLARDLYQSYVKNPELVKLVMDVEKVNIDIDTAIPLGLILNELITNSMKHGFPDGMEGTVFIEFSKKDDTYILKVGDDGVGIPSDLDFRNTSSLGMQLVSGLVGQIDGEIELNRNDGTEFVIKFKEMKL
ncbi:MAG: PAS domain S-box protein [Methanobacterium sp.]|jgi:PAS domain S-box-containing protein|uniref:PAS domain S-box protein n=1 Tax=Methanobacterium sp. TaxID=2164 RepID=UPI003D8DEBB5